MRSHIGEEDWFSINNEKVDEAAKQGARGFSNLFAAAEELIREPPMSEDLPTQPWSVLSELCTRVMADCLPTSSALSSIFAHCTSGVGQTTGSPIRASNFVSAVPRHGA